MPTTQAPLSAREKRLPTLAAELVALQVAVIVCPSTDAWAAARNVALGVTDDAVVEWPGEDRQVEPVRRPRRGWLLHGRRHDLRPHVQP